MKKIIITSATELEVQPLKELLCKSNMKNILFHTSGVGILQSCFAIQKMILEQKPDLLIQVGIAGTFDEQGVFGDVVVVKEEMFGSCGVEENDEWKDIFDLKLGDKNIFPFSEKKLINPFLEEYNPLKLEEVSAITVDEISTNKNRIAQLKSLYNPFLESMEGASLHYCALQYEIPFLQIRGISNHVGERNKAGWKIKDAVKNVCEKCFQLLERIHV